QPPRRHVRLASAIPVTPFAMSTYRYYFLDTRRYVVDCRLITCETDDAARDFADGLLAQTAHPAIEVWEGLREVYEARKPTPA
ncbi:MAG TPA: hypothetical protein VMQ73_22825, partial [Methylomirabilota bacterium]|nr:hypothetical protein [Methylomirabilota bacterium]